jgi:hypothetical protein
VAGGGGDLGDTGPHGPGADNADGAVAGKGGHRTNPSFVWGFMAGGECQCRGCEAIIAVALKN